MSTNAVLLADSPSKIERCLRARVPMIASGYIYKARHLIETFFAKIKQFRAIATRYDKTARNSLAAVDLTAAAIWLN